MPVCVFFFKFSPSLKLITRTPAFCGHVETDIPLTRQRHTADNQDISAARIISHLIEKLTLITQHIALRTILMMPFSILIVARERAGRGVQFAGSVRIRSLSQAVSYGIDR